MPKSVLHNRSIFVNCPYDDEYYPLLKGVLFAVLRLGFNPRLALEKNDSSENRIDKIVKIIDECKYSIHDLSRSKAKKTDEMARFNMPFELGIDYGCLKFSDERRTKTFLILEKCAHDSKRCLSDLSGVDVSSHDDSVMEAMKQVRDWLYHQIEGDSSIPSGRSIFEKDYSFEFQAWYLKEAKKAGYDKNDYEKIQIPEYIDYVKKWLKKKKDISFVNDDVKFNKKVYN